LARLPDVELCWAWRVSFRSLLERDEPAWRGQVVVARQAYLDELERRHPDEVAAWLASGPDPCGGPERFLRRPASGRDAA
jgi:hypothetical protein